MDTNAGDTETRLAQLAGEVRKTRADLLGEARGTAERLRAVEKTAGGLKPTIIAAAVGVLIGAAIIALVLGQFLTSQIRAAVADAVTNQSAAIAPVAVAPPDAAPASPPFAVPAPPAPPAVASRGTAPSPHPVGRAYPAPRPGAPAPNTP